MSVKWVELFDILLRLHDKGNPIVSCVFNLFGVTVFVGVAIVLLFCTVLCFGLLSHSPGFFRVISESWNWYKLSYEIGHKDMIFAISKTTSIYNDWVFLFFIMTITYILPARISKRNESNWFVVRKRLLCQRENIHFLWFIKCSLEASYESPFLHQCTAIL